MRKLLLALAATLLISTQCFAVCDVTIDGNEHCDFDVTDWEGISPAPAISDSNSARVYFDIGDGKLKCSEDGGAYTDCVGGGGAGNVTTGGTLTDEAIVRGAGSTTVQDSVVFINDTGTMTMGDGSQSVLNLNFNLSGTDMSLSADSGVIYASHAFTSLGTLTGPGSGYVGQAAQCLVGNVFQNTDQNCASGTNAAKFTATQTNTGAAAYAAGVENYGIRSATGNTNVAAFTTGSYNLGQFTGTGTQGLVCGAIGGGFVNNAGGTITTAGGLCGQEFTTPAGAITLNNAISSNGRLTIFDGTASTDGLQFSSALGTAPDVSIYRPAAVSLTINSAASGRIYMGTATAANTQSTTKFAVGGTTAPHISALMTGAFSSTGGAFINVMHNNGASSQPATGDRLGGLLFTANRDASNFTNTAAVITYAAEGWTSSASGGYMTFETTPLLSTTRSERLRINHNGDIGIGTSATTISARLHALSTTEQMRIAYDASNYYSTTVSSSGGVTLNAAGSGSAFSFSDGVTVTTLTDSALTAGRVTFASTAGLLADDADMTFATDTLTVTKLAAHTLTGNETLAENVSIVLPAFGSLTADGKYAGVTEVVTAGETVAFGDVVYLKAADSQWYLTDADADATAGAVRVAIAVTTGADNGSMTVMTYGKIRADANFPAMTVGAPVYIGTTGGEVQVAQPSGADDVIRIMGYANSGDELFFNPSNDYLTHI